MRYGMVFSVLAVILFAASCGSDNVTGPQLFVGSATASLGDIGGEQIVRVDLTLLSSQVCGFSLVNDCFDPDVPLGWDGNAAKGSILAPSLASCQGLGNPPGSSGVSCQYARLLPEQWAYPDGSVIPAGGDYYLRIQVPGANPSMRVVVYTHPG